MKLKKIMSMALALCLSLTVQVSLGSSTLFAAESAKNGLRGDYYLMTDTGVNFGQYMLTAIDSNINWTDTKTMLKQNAGRDEYVTVRWIGWIKTPAGGSEGTYKFETSTDDSLRLWINNTQLIDWWGSQWDSNSSTWGHSGEITLTPNTYYPFKMEYCQGYGGAFARLRWSKTSGGSTFSNVIVPADAFFLDEEFNPPIITNVDDSDIENRIVTLDVENFTDDTTLNLHIFSDTMQAKPIAVANPGVVGGKVTVTLPGDVGLGIYRFIAEESDIKTASDYFSTMTLEGTPRAEYPRPDYARDETWETLNGPWDFRFDRSLVGDGEGWAANGLPEDHQTIMVPYPWQSPASGIYDETNPGGTAWYQREFIPDADKYDGKQVYIRFGAVDCESWLYINGVLVGENKSGYTPFEYDVTDFVTLGQVNTIRLKVTDNGYYGDNTYTALIGKQGRNAPCGYAGTSGIWQSVIFEGRRSETQLEYAHFDPLPGVTDSVVPTNGTARVNVKINNAGGKKLMAKYNLTSVIWDEGSGENIVNSGAKASAITGQTVIEVPSGNDAFETTILIDVPNQQLWTPDEPNLYDGTLTLADDGTGEVYDVIKTYFGQRSLETAVWNNTEGYKYLLLNGKPIFLAGLLDQGFWEEGVYTAPSEDALKYDIKAMRDLGFNLIRKHLKIEDPLQYMWCDRLGMFVWQDMPHATNQRVDGGQDGTGRALYAEALTDLIKRDYNHPSLMSYILFNETWGFSTSGRNQNDANWIIEMYNLVKSLDTSGRLVEDMSPCNYDHIQPTDMNTFHMYPSSWSSAVSTVQSFDNGNYIGSTHNFNQWGAAANTYTNDGDPWLNSEYGGVGAYAGDYDISWCFKYQTDVLRLRQKLQGYVYTEPYDIEYERNGLLKYDRSSKVMGYDEIAYGGDMSVKYLNQAEYVGVSKDPLVTLIPGDEYSATIGMIRWSDKHTGPFTLKYRVDGIDQFGNKVGTTDVTGFRGSQEISYDPYVYETKSISFNVPATSRFNRFAGTVTVWIEDGDGETIAKNFANFKVVSPIGAKASEQISDNSYVLRLSSATNSTSDGSVEGNKTGSLTYQYSLPATFDVNDLTSLRLFAEISAAQKLSTNGTSSHRPQTAEGYETPSDVTVTVNGYEVDTVFIPDAPCDMRGIMSLSSGSASQTAGFGYLVNIDLDRELVALLKEELLSNPTLTVKYEVKDDADNKNGLRAFNDTAGRYAVSPSVVLNPPELYHNPGISEDGSLGIGGLLPSSNFSVEAEVTGDYAVIDAGYSITVSERTISVAGNGIDEAVSYVSGTPIDRVKVTFFEEQVRVYVNNNPQYVIDVYGDDSASTEVSVSAGLANVTVLPETYVTKTAVLTGINTQFVENFSGSGTTASWRWASARGTWTRDTTNYRMPFSSGYGTLLYNTAVTVSDAVVEFDMNFGGTNPGDTYNAGIVVRSQSDYTDSSDGANGIYIGIGYQHSNTRPTGAVGYLQIGCVANHLWAELTRVKFPHVGLEWSNTATYHFKIVMVGSRYTVYINNVLVSEFYDSTYSSGSIALRNWNCGTAGWYDNIVVSSAPVYEASFTMRSTYGPNSSGTSTNGMSGFNYNGVLLDEWQKYGGWAVENEALRASGEGYALVGNDTWRDASVSVKMTLDEDSSAGLTVRTVNGATGIEGYAVKVDSSDSTVTLGALSGGLFYPIKTADASVVPGVTDTLKVTAVSNVIKVYYNGSANPIITFIDNSYSTGKFGLMSYEGGVLFDDVSATDKYRLEENMYDGAMDGFTFYGGEWSLADGVISVGTGTDNKAVTGYATLADFELEFDYRYDSTDGNTKSNGSVIFRGTDFGSSTDQMKGYYVSLGTSGGSPHLEFGDLRYGWRLVSQTYDITANTGQWYHFKIRAVGLSIQVYIEDVLIFNLIDSAQGYRNGQIGFRNFHCGASFKNLVVRQLDDVATNPSGIFLSSEVKDGGYVAMVDNFGVEDTPVRLIAAIYNTDGKLVYTEEVTRTASVDSTLIRRFAFDPSQYAECTIKVFAWDPDTYVPLNIETS